jgi:hypothetical protein
MRPTKDASHADNEVEPSGFAESSDKLQLVQWLDAIKTNMPVSLGRPRHVAVDVSALVVAAVIGYWLGGSRVA